MCNSDGVTDGLQGAAPWNLKIIQCQWSTEFRGEKAGELNGTRVHRDLGVTVRSLPFRQGAMGHRKVWCRRLAFIA